MTGVLSRTIVVVLLHGAVLYGAIRLNPEFIKQIEPLMVNLITPPQPLPQAPPVLPARPATPRPALQAKAQPVPAMPVPAPAAPRAITIEAPPPSPSAPPPPGPATEGVKAAPPAAAAPVVPPRFDAAYLDNSPPGYPAPSRRRGEQGRVELRVHVTAAGSASNVEVHVSSGFPGLDHAAREAVARWRFVPARQGEQPVDAWVIVPIVFSLEG